MSEKQLKSEIAAAAGQLSESAEDRNIHLVVTQLLEFLNHKADGFQEEVDGVRENIKHCVNEVFF